MSGFKVLAIIPARGGSKGVPLKNIKLLAGKPLLTHTIEFARSSASVDRVIVTTDHPGIADAARASGAEVPFLRPSELATDETPGLAPVVHAVEWLAEHEEYQPDAVAMLQPTSPFRPRALLDEAVGVLRDLDCEMVLCLTSAKRHPFWMKTLENGLVQPFLPLAEVPTRRQDLPPAFAISGSVYLWTRAALLRRRSANSSGATQFAGEKVGAVLVDGLHALDIDTELDFLVAEVIAQRIKAGTLGS